MSDSSADGLTKTQATPHGNEAEGEAQHDVSGQHQRMIAGQHVALLHECGERGETTAQTCGEQQPCVRPKTPERTIGLGQTGEEANEQTTEDVDHEGAGGKRSGHQQPYDLGNQEPKTASEEAAQRD